MEGEARRHWYQWRRGASLKLRATPKKADAVWRVQATRQPSKDKSHGRGGRDEGDGGLDADEREEDGVGGEPMVFGDDEAQGVGQPWLYRTQFSRLSFCSPRTTVLNVDL